MTAVETTESFDDDDPAAELLAELTDCITPDASRVQVPGPESAAWPPRLAGHHRTYLHNRAVDPCVAAARGYYTAHDSSELPNERWAMDVRGQLDDPDEPSTALVIPLWSAADAERPVLHQLRLDHPRSKPVAAGKAPKPLKFELPGGAQRGSSAGELPADVHPWRQQEAVETSWPLIVTEGVAKGDALLSASLTEGLTVVPVTLTGVTMGYLAAESAANPGLRAVLSPAITRTLPLERVIYLCWDADWRTNLDVAHAMIKTGRLLEAKHAIVRIVDVPPAKNAQTGVDDYLALARLDGVPTPLASILASAIDLDEAEHLAKTYPATDAGRADRLAAEVLRRGSHRYHAETRTWLRWTGTHWTSDERGSIVQLTIALTDRDAEREARSKGQAASAIRAAIDLAGNRPEVAVVAADLDRDPWLLNAANGTVDLHTGELRPHDPADLITTVTPTGYHPDATCPTWRRFLAQTFGGDRELISWLQRLFGSGARGIVDREVLPIFFGGGRNGKTTLTNAVRGALGGYAATIKPSVLTGQADDYQRATLRGKRLVTTAETGIGHHLDEQAVKEMCSRDPINARVPYGRPFSFAPSHMLVLSTNHRPVVTAQDDGTWRRLCFVPFTRQVPPQEVDEALDAKLAAEYPGILRWIVEGAVAYAIDGLGDCAVIRSATSVYRDEQDLVGRFVAEECVAGPATHVKRPAFYARWQSWCIDQGKRPWALAPLLERLREMGILDPDHETKKVNGHILLVGVGLAVKQELQF